MITGTGACWVCAKVMRFSSEPWARSVSGLPTRFSKVSNPWTASSPLVVPEKVRMASAILASVSIAGRPSAAPPSITPPDWASCNRAVRARIDRNEDGKIDRWEYYDEHSNLVKVGLSRGDTGAPDAWAFASVDGKTHRLEISSSADEKKIDRWEHYVGETIATAEEDTNHDGVVDKWETYEGGALKTASLDENGDGKPDRRLSYADGSLVAIDSDPDASGAFRKHVVVTPN